MKTVLLPLAAFLFLLGHFSTEFADPDAWWHLKMGEHAVTQRRLASPDPFAYTTALAKPAYPGEELTREFNLTHEWLAQALWFLLWRAGGFPAVVLWKALLLTSLCAMTGYIAARRTKSALWGAAAALAASTVAIHFAHDRPSILSFVFTAAFIAILETGRRLWLLPALALLWANLHGGFFLGWIVCAAYAAEALIRRDPAARRLLATGAATIAISAINPNGCGAIPTLVRYRDSALTSTLMEWRSPGLWGTPYAFHILLYAAAATLLIARRRVRISDWILFAAFAAASLIAYRNTMLIGALAPVLIASYFPFPRPLPAWTPPAAAASLAIALVWGAASGRFFQLRAAEWKYPAGAARFLAERRMTAPLFNTYEYGGYLLWSGQRVFIDGRALSESVFHDYRVIMTASDPAARAETLARYGVGTVVLNAFEYNSGILYPLVVALAGDPGWMLLYEDPQSMIFARQAPPGAPPLDKRRILDHLESECRLHIEREPEYSLCARTLGDFFARAGELDRARRSLALYLQHPYDDDPEARRAYQRLIAR